MTQVIDIKQLYNNAQNVNKLLFLDSMIDFCHSLNALCNIGKEAVNIYLN